MNGKDLELAEVINAHVVRARRFEILDAKSHTRAFIDTIDNEAVFVLTNESGLRTVEIRAGGESGAQISFLQDGHTTRFAVGLSGKSGNATLALLDADGRARFKVEVDEGGTVAKT